MTERQQREANLGAILVCISLLFILCQSIKIIPDVSYIGFANAILHLKYTTQPIVFTLNHISLLGI